MVEFEFVLSKINKITRKYETNCPFKLAKQLGIHIVYENLGNTLGYFNKFCRIKMIHINENTSDLQKTFICAHELGHALLHPDANTPFLKKNTLFSTEKIEQEANYFAIKLLFTDADLVPEVGMTELYTIPKLIARYVEEGA